MNFNSPDWKLTVDEIDQRISRLDITNRAAKSAEETAHLRGQIAALLSLRNWEATSALPTVEELRFQ